MAVIGITLCGECSCVYMIYSNSPWQLKVQKQIFHQENYSGKTFGCKKARLNNLFIPLTPYYNVTTIHYIIYIDVAWGINPLYKLQLRPLFGLGEAIKLVGIRTKNSMSDTFPGVQRHLLVQG